MRRLTGLMAALLTTAITIPSPKVVAETWTDQSGAFSIEAEFKGVEGTSVVLLKENGVQIKVPISRLSEESKALAKSLYEAMKPGATTASPQSPTNAEAATNVIPARSLNFTPPEPPVLAAMPAFPDNATLQETVDFVTNQLKVGHLEVLWHALPDEMRSELDSPEIRQTVNPFMQQQSQLLKSVETLVFKAIEVLVTKKQFVLGSSLMQQVPPPMLPVIGQCYDPAVGVVFELADLSFRTSDLQDLSITTLINHYGPRIGGHAKELMQLAPLPGGIDMALGDLTVEMIDSDHGVIKAPPAQPFGAPDAGFGAESEDIEMTRFMGRWIPSDLASEWPSMKEMMQNELEGALEAQQNSEDIQGATMMVGMMTGLVGGVLDQLLAAESQEAFDQVLTQSAAMLGPNLGGGGLGGPGGPGFGPGGPGFGEDDGGFGEIEIDNPPNF